MHMELLSAGQMAELNKVSKKALRLYEQKGLLAPYRVDPETGYRYYTHDQCAMIDTIQQMEAVGFTLSEIKTILDTHDVELTRRVLERQTELLERKAFEVKIAQHAVDRLLRSCDMYENPPEFEQPRLVHMRRRRILRFPITPYHFEPRPTQDNPRLRRWEMALREIKEQFVARGIPLALFHNIGCIIDGASLADRSFTTVGGFVIDVREHADEQSSWFPEGYFLTVTIGSTLTPDGEHAEYRWLCNLLDLAEERGYTVCGDYYSEMLVESPLFSYEGRDMMMGLYLPVDIRSARAAR